MEADGSLTCSQRSATGPYLKPDAPNPHPSTLYPFLYYLLIYAKVFRAVPSL